MVDRPLECSECKKSLKIRYTEIVGKETTVMGMCPDCPILRRRLQGSGEECNEYEPEGRKAGLCCGNCGTTLETVRMGNPLGCGECYNVFADVIIQDLTKANRIGKRSLDLRTGESLHVGRSVGEQSEVNLSARLVALHEALNETLNKEDYEQAALLRDQIKAITEEAENDNTE
jgi:protein arginine kinase activator